MHVDLLPSDAETNAFSNSVFSRLVAFVASLCNNVQIDLHSNSGFHAGNAVGARANRQIHETITQSEEALLV